jgi:hypothetical protein
MPAARGLIASLADPRIGASSRFGQLRATVMGMSGRAWLVATVVATAAMAAAPSLAAASGAPSISVDQADFPSLVGIGVNFVIVGVADHAPAGVVAAIEQEDAGMWRVRTTAALQGGSFQLTLRPIVSGTLDLRVALRAHGADIATTSSQEITVAYQIPCGTTPTAPSALPAGDGWVVGYLSWSGGGHPPKDATADWGCNSDAPFTVFASDAASPTWAASALIPGGEYELVLPAGSYWLGTQDFGRCYSTGFTVAAGQQSAANVICWRY